MGRLHYGDDGTTARLDDDDLEHLEVVIVNKLRRAEPFLLTVESTDALEPTVAFWIHEHADLRFAFDRKEAAPTDRTRLEHMIQQASSTAGLHLRAV
ncbi:hypothetical protein GCM10009846_04140 [Agrococcus versicolor]|uniref:DUF7882 domain-containing protein n=1 Tax=Agrococcus versicolor TaxID=501482 RepID=A0ABP5MDU5_9MICO